MVSLSELKEQQPRAGEMPPPSHAAQALIARGVIHTGPRSHRPHCNKIEYTTQQKISNKKNLAGLGKVFSEFTVAAQFSFEFLSLTPVHNFLEQKVSIINFPKLPLNPFMITGSCCSSLSRRLRSRNPGQQLLYRVPVWTPLLVLMYTSKSMYVTRHSCSAAKLSLQSKWWPFMNLIERACNTRCSRQMKSFAQSNYRNLRLAATDLLH